MSQIRRVQTEDEFEALLRADRAIVFFWVPWAIQARWAERVVEAWVRDHTPPVDVHRVDPDDQPFVVRWLAGKGKEMLGYAGSGAVIWLREGRIVAELLSPLWGGQNELDRQSRQAFLPGQTP